MKEMKKMKNIDNIGLIQDLNKRDECTWVKHELKPITSVPCFIPKKLQEIMATAEQLYPNFEYSFFFKCKLKNRGIEINPHKWIFPKQAVTGVSIRYIDEHPGYNCCIHKHPKGINSFSSTDAQYINANFEVSLLYVNDQFKTGIVNLKTKIGIVQLPVTCIMESLLGIRNDVELMMDNNLIEDKPIQVIGQNIGMSNRVGYGRRETIDGNEQFEFDNLFEFDSHFKGGL
jgi:hypothetical protein